MATEEPLLLNPGPDTSHQNKKNDDSGTQSSGSGDRANTTQRQSGANAGGTTQAGTAETPTATVYQATPNRRRNNPLGEFSSYTYQVTLYMITPDAYDRFVDSGRQQMEVLNQSSVKGKGGAVIICQSGGIDNSSTTRADGFKYDYYIDDLKIDSYVNAKSTQSSTNVTDITFNIIEPYGFSFITNLKRAADQLQQYCNTENYKDLQNPTRQFYILGLRFQGYDKNGNIMTGKEEFLGEKLDPSQSNNSSGIFERYYDIIIRSIKFKINGQATVYNISANSIAPAVAMGLKHGFSDKDIQVTSSTVGGAVTEFLDKLTKQQEIMLSKNQIKVKNTYKVVFQDKEIENASIVNKNDLDKFSYGMSVKETAKSTEANAVRNKTPANPTEKKLSFVTNTPILQVIENIIVNSSYMRDAIEVVYYNNLNKANDIVPPQDRPSKISWYNVSAKITETKWDPKVGDWAYTITYFIKKYLTPVMISAYAKIAPKYYGPHKVYNYWYTGENKEILNYEQALDNAWFMVAVVPSEGGYSQGGPVDVSNAPHMRPDAVRQGGYDKSLDPINTYVSYLTDPGAYAKVKMTIIGDPDFMIQDSPGNIKAVYDRFYGDDGFTINANGGQVFIEINFKEAVDYDNNTGLLSINESIQFWAYPAEIKKIVKEGVSYMVLRVTSNFRGGKFTQDLECLINTFPETLPNNANARSVDPYYANEYEISRSQATSPYASPGNSNIVTGLKSASIPNAVLTLKNGSAETLVSVTTPIAQPSAITSPTGGLPNSGFNVADDDAHGVIANSVKNAGREVNSTGQLISDITTEDRTEF